jgi:hypothetical protein
VLGRVANRLAGKLSPIGLYDLHEWPLGLVVFPG